MFFNLFNRNKHTTETPEVIIDISDDWDNDPFEEGRDLVEFTEMIDDVATTLFDMEIEAAMTVERFITDICDDIKIAVVAEPNKPSMFWLSCDNEVEFTNDRKWAATMFVNAMAS